MKRHSPRPALNRRQVLASVGGAAVAALAAPYVRASTAASNQLVLVTWGGNYRQGIEDGLVKPFTQETGINVTILDTPDMAKVKAQAMTNNVQWDVFDAPGSMGASGAANGYWEELPSGLFDESDLLLPSQKALVPFFTFAGGIAYDPARFPDGKHPRTFADYFNAEAFPGRRTLRPRAMEILEIALLGDGVAPVDLYPLDVERAFKVLERIKPHVSKWVEATPQTVTLLQTGEADFSFTYANRIQASNRDQGVKLAFSFDQNLNGVEYLAVLKNAPNKENAFKFLSFAMRPEYQASCMEAKGGAPISRKAYDLMKRESLEWLPKLDAPNNAYINDAWWATNLEPLERRFKEWLLG
ncbi:ABC transporter substrate-binding protein [Sinirhodobacter populi]|uniref:ABC transporter substrate-binding protein n=1 Tax=Paenirhodobacter populi TaxID=2306993 RepID=A0A443K2E9_9RHOB|nr:ABC transporter substrate-binding protein [Sinirhodobacter populi]RWR26940.1 ABC transporter substrate-binding protein [Sinirhodobacter populi]